MNDLDLIRRLREMAEALETGGVVAVEGKSRQDGSLLAETAS